MLHVDIKCFFSVTMFLVIVPLKTGGLGLYLSVS
jgi:hypothetical protein